MAKLFKKVAIIGVGLIGGSIGLAIKRKGLAEKVTGVSRHIESIRLAKKIGAIDEGSQKLDLIKAADFLILAAPVEVIIGLSARIAKLVDKNCIVTDVASTKEQVVSLLEKRFNRYVGSHPLAGSEKRSIRHADGNIFKGSLCILTPTHKSDRGALNKISNFWRKLDVKTYFLSPVVHDRVVSFTSHLPHLIAFSLLNCIPRNFLGFSATALRDATRIASSDAKLWSGIFLSNRKNILGSCASFKKMFSEMESAIKKNDSLGLSGLLEKARKKRSLLK